MESKDTTSNTQELRSLEMKARERDLHDYLCTLSLPELRSVMRITGTGQPSGSSKEDLAELITGKLTGRIKPRPFSKRGAPAKNVSVAPEILAKIDLLQKRYTEIAQPSSSVQEELGLFDGKMSEGLSVESPVKAEIPYEQAPTSGILEITQAGYGFLRVRNCQPSTDGDVFIPTPVIKAMRLRVGDYITCTAKPKLKSDSAAVQEILRVNGLPAGAYEGRPQFDSLTAKYSREKIELSRGCNETSLRLLDLFAPIGKGQRALIIAPPKAGKTTLLKSVARAIAENHREIRLIILLIDERPEEVTDMRESVKDAEIVYSTFDEGHEHHVRAAALTLEHAKRLAELGKDVVILLDSLTKLTRAYNYTVESSGKTLTGGLDAAAFSEPKRFFGAARNTVEAGSITILATALVETGSRMDDIIYEEFKGTGNSDIFLSRDLAERRIFPAIDIRRSGTRKEELLLTPEELAAVYKMRERGLVENVAGIIEMIKRTDCNADFVARLPEWLKVYKTT